MKVYVAMNDAKTVLGVMARAEGEDIVGDMGRELRPGQSYMGRTFEEWLALGKGEHEIPDK